MAGDTVALWGYARIIQNRTWAKREICYSKLSWVVYLETCVHGKAVILIWLWMLYIYS